MTRLPFSRSIHNYMWFRFLTWSLNGSCVMDPLPSISNKLNKSFISCMSFFVVPIESVQKILQNFQHKNRFKIMETRLLFLNTRYLLANQNRPFRQVNFPFSVIFKFSRFFFIWGWYSGQKRRVLTNSRHLSSTNEFRLSVEDIYFFSLTVFLNVPNLCHPPDSKWKDKSYNKVAKSGNLEEVWTIFYN